MEEYEIVEKFADKNLNRGRMVSWSKTEYRIAYPDNLVIFNCNVITESNGKVWYGDLDLNVSGDKLKEIAKEIGEPLYVLSEHDARFGKEKQSNKDLIKLAKWSTNS